jgi:hypothetical protein
MEEVEKHIYTLDDRDGYFYEDETSFLNGPYETLENCREALKKYIVYLEAE